MSAITKILATLLIIPFTVMAQQQQKISFCLRIPITIESQEAEITYGPREIQKNNSLNFGMGCIASLQISKQVSVSAGLGYFRERFNIKRPYNHRALNAGRDSVLILLVTRNYNYHLLEIPVGVNYSFSKKKNSTRIGIQYVPAFSLSSSYNGGVPFPNANTTRNATYFFSHSVNLSVAFPFTISNLKFSMDPFVRIMHTYKKDILLYENENETISKNLDAFGVALTYQFSFHH